MKPQQSFMSRITSALENIWGNKPGESRPLSVTPQPQQSPQPQQIEQMPNEMPQQQPIFQTVQPGTSGITAEQILQLLLQVSGISAQSNPLPEPQQTPDLSTLIPQNNTSMVNQLPEPNGGGLYSI